MLDDQPKKAAIFDLDKTILSTASTMATAMPSDPEADRPR